LISVTASPALCQPSAANYQVGSITAVNGHASGTGDRKVSRYDISVEVGNTLYVVLYTPPDGTYGVNYAAGLDLLVSVGNDTITFNDMLGRTSEVPILSRKALPRQNDLDLAQSPERYFTTKRENLSRKLNLTEDQQAQLRPIVEQEVGELGAIRCNPVLSLKEKVRKFETIVGGSDHKLKAMLSVQQWQILQNMRKEQKRELKELVAAKKQPVALPKAF
jgi:hypothetical protein